MFLIVIGVTCVFGLYAGKLFMLQAVRAGAADLASQSVQQRAQSVVLDTGRGDFYDCEGRPITGKTGQGLLVFPAAVERKELAAVIGVPERDWLTFTKTLREPRFWPGPSGEPLALSAELAARIAALQLPGVAVAEFKTRYPAPFYGGSLIGYIGQNPERIRAEFTGELRSGRLTLDSAIGAAGLERTFQRYLQGIGSTSIALFRDGANEPLGGLRLRSIAPRNDRYPLRIETTLELPVQRDIERLLERYRIAEGAVVVLDAANADVVAMASRPAFDPAAARDGRDNWANRALQAIAPGSVFKTVVAAALLDERLARPSDTFECGGELGKYGFSCWQPFGHGTITLEEAYAQSCNIAFAQAMAPLSSQTLAEYAVKLGLTRPVGWSGSMPGVKAFRQFDAEQPGQLFAAATPQDDEGARMQTAIGQRDVRMTPLQAANLVVTLLSGGEVKQPRVVKRIAYRTGETLHALPEKRLVARGHGISPATARRIAGWMKEVVGHGTGRSLQASEWPLAGKSGTAQEAPALSSAVTQWFVGYGPASRPRYAVAVALQHMPPGQEGEAQDVFREVMHILATKSHNG